jgi:predicted nucleotidyltransferase
MNQTLTPDQISDLAAIRKSCDEMGTDVVVIGATALLLSIGDLGRFTRDVDFTVALDLSEFGQLIQRLLATGWKQVFASAIEMDLSADVRIRVAPASVTALLRIIAYMDAPYRRAKDLQDIEIILRRYAAGSDRLFSDEVFDAELRDFNMAKAFLLGLDLRRLATNEEVKYVEQFLERFMASEEGRDAGDSGMGIFHGQIRALQIGFKGQ